MLQDGVDSQQLSEKHSPQDSTLLAAKSGSLCVHSWLHSCAFFAPVTPFISAPYTLLQKSAHPVENKNLSVQFKPFIFSHLRTLWSLFSCKSSVCLTYAKQPGGICTQLIANLFSERKSPVRGGFAVVMHRLRFGRPLPQRSRQQALTPRPGVFIRWELRSGRHVLIPGARGVEYAHGRRCMLGDLARR